MNGQSESITNYLTFQSGTGGVFVIKIEEVKKTKVAMVREMIESQEYKCALTGWELTPDNFSLDHILPVASGGTDDIGNLQAVRSDANAAKGQMTNDDFIAMCRAVVRVHGMQ